MQLQLIYIYTESCLKHYGLEVLYNYDVYIREFSVVDNSWELSLLTKLLHGDVFPFNRIKPLPLN